MNDQLQQRISLDPKLMLGKPVIRGTRIPVEIIVRMLDVHFVNPSSVFCWTKGEI